MHLLSCGAWAEVGGGRLTLTFPCFDVAGSHREIGRQVGEGGRERVAASLAYYQETYEELAGMTLAEGTLQAQAAFLPPARAYAPELIEQLEGLAEGAGVPFADLFLLNCGEEFTCPPEIEPDAAGHPAAERRAVEHCTSLAIMAGDRHVAGHNEDWYAGDAQNMVLVRATLPGGQRYVSMTCAAYLPFTGMTSSGTACSANTLYATDFRMRGVPNQLIVASLLLCSDLESAVACIGAAERGRGSNHLLADTRGRIWNVETSATDLAITEASGWYAHTNHYAAAKMQRFEGSPWEGSRKRLARANDLLRDGVERGDDPVELAARVLVDHENGVSSICGHSDPSEPEAERTLTTASMVWDLDERRVHVCAGPPCENERRSFSL
jgi:isopenicillin-N N-acyltransferase-like protein